MPHLQPLLSQAIGHHQAGRYPEALALYQQVLAIDPRHADALRLMGVVAYELGRHEAAVELLGQAIAINPNIAEYHNDLGLALHALARNTEATAAFDEALRINPALALTHYNLANIHKTQGRLQPAVEGYRRAIRLMPAFAEAHNNLGTALQSMGLHDQAEEAFRAAIQMDPRHAGANGNLGMLLQVQGRLHEAIDAYKAALSLRGNDPTLLENLGTALQAAGRLQDALAAHRASIALRPENAQGHYHLGNTLLALRQFQPAIGAYGEALRLNPRHAEAQNNLGTALRQVDQLSQAAEAFRGALVLNPQFAEVHNNLGSALFALNDVDGAVASYQAALAINPAYAEAWCNLGAARKEQGLLDEAIACFRGALARRPDSSDFAGNLIYTLHFHPGYGTREIAAELAQWNEPFTSPLARLIEPHAHDRSPDRPLRIGWVSPDFRRHPIGRFLEPLFARHDRESFQYYCYSDVRAEDATTLALQANVHRWRRTADSSHDELAAVIRQDRIDILLDITMHMQGSRLPAFARKPAPIQVTYLAYCSSTGLRAMDYRITDRFLETSVTDIYSEKPLMLESYWCYAADGAAPPVSPLPAATTGAVTFGCLNNFCKVSAPALEVWLRILRVVPGSQLLLHAAPGSHRKRVQDFLASGGIDPTRCRFVGMMPFDQYLALYHQIDIALDPFPYAGGTTSCDALYMGVPVVTVAGQTPVGRSGVSLLSQLGLKEFIASTAEQYVEIAAGLARNMARLGELRAALRPAMVRSRLMDGEAFARDFEGIFRRIWRNWCENQ